MNEFNEEQYREVMLKYGFALNILETNLNILLDDYEYKNDTSIVDHVKVRLKSHDSALKKLRDKGYDATIDNLINHVHDMVGLRIVCPFLNDVYTVLNIIKNSNLFKIKEEKDYIANPKDTGYISYHLLVLVPVALEDGTEYIEAEIQIRTMAMDFWASLDHKLQYKFTKDIPNEVKEEIYKCSMDIKKIDEKMLKLREFIKNYMDNE